MKSGKITPEQLAAIGTRPAGRQHPFRNLLAELEAGEICFLAMSDWKWKHQTPRRFLNDLERSGERHYTLSKVRDGSGWVVVRER